MPRIFVFGSNEQGLHGGGAARVARELYGAIWGHAEGLQGQSYAIPTCKFPTGSPGFEIPFERLKEYVDRFVGFAKLHPELQFQVTQVGCGLAGWKAEQVAPLFVDAPANCFFDTAWKKWLPETAQMWGTV